MLALLLATGVMLSDLTWPEAEKVLKPDKVVVIPLGAAAKEHGPHLKLKNDLLMADALARRVREARDVVIAPTIDYSFYPAFLEYPGSTSLRLETARDMVVDICRSLAHYGPKRFYILNTGISTLRMLPAAAEILKGDGIVLRYTDLHVTEAVERTMRKEEGGTHADEIETSMMLYLAPDSVDMKKAVKDYHGDAPGGLTRDPKGRGVYSPTGVWGDATLATREKGRIVTEALVQSILDDVDSLRGALPAAPTVAPDRPVLVGEGVISTGDYESHPAFTPDEKTLYFLKDAPSFEYWTIFVSDLKDGRWSEPRLAPFSGQFRDADPFITADGSKLFFISSRPVPGKTHRDLDIWVMDRTSDGGWSEPHNLGAPVNSDGQEWYPTVAADGTLYFGSDRPGGKGRTDLYRTRFVDGRYLEPENLGDAINTPMEEYEPYVAPDQSFLLFMGDNRDGRGDSDLFVSYQRNGVWTKAVPLPPVINSAAAEYSPKVSADGKTFYWTSCRSKWRSEPSRALTTEEYLRKTRSPGNGLGDIYQIDVKALGLEP